MAGCEFALPVEREAHGFELGAHRVDVGVGPLAGMDLAFHCGVLCRHAERIPTHWVEYVETLRALVTGEHVTHRIVPDVAHVDAAGWVWEHL